MIAISRIAGGEAGCGITPRRLLELTTSHDAAAAKRAFDAMMTMRKIDIAAIEAAAKGS